MVPASVILWLGLWSSISAPGVGSGRVWRALGPWSANPQQQSLGALLFHKKYSDRSKQTPFEVLILFWWCFQCFDRVLIDFLQADSANLRVWTPGAVGRAWFWAWFGAWFGAWFWAWLPMKNTRLEVLILFLVVISVFRFSFN